eukprot:2234097-Pyramimonas_sp.AAC.1
MEGRIEIHAQEIAARKRAASAAIDDNKPAKRTAVSSQGEYCPREERPISRCFPDKTEWSRPSYAGNIRFARNKGMELALHDVETQYIIHTGRPSRYRTEGRFSRYFPDDL